MKLIINTRKIIPAEREYPYLQDENSINEYKGQQCQVLKLRYKASGAENIEALIRTDADYIWVPFMALRYQCCAECGY